MSCQRVISRRRVGREAGRERVAYDVMRLKALRKRDKVAGAGSSEVEAEDRRESEAKGVPLTVTTVCGFSELGVPVSLETLFRHLSSFSARFVKWYI